MVLVWTYAFFSSGKSLLFLEGCGANQLLEQGLVSNVIANTGSLGIRSGEESIDAARTGTADAARDATRPQ